MLRRIRISVVQSALIALTLLLASCFSLHLSTGPIDSIEYTAPERNNSMLVVFLPGILDSARDFERRGWIKAVRDRGLPIDMIAVDAHYGYYFAGNVIERLHTDVIAPARRRGYVNIWLVGVSLGGFGSLLYSRAYPQDIEGAYLISPFLGDPNGGFDPAEWLENRNGQDGLWEWLLERRGRQDGAPTIFLAYGEQDKFAHVNELLARFLKQSNVVHLPGEHDWKTWKALWDEVLDRHRFPPDKSAGTRSEPRASNPEVGA